MYDLSILPFTFLLLFLHRLCPIWGFQPFGAWLWADAIGGEGKAWLKKL